MDRWRKIYISQVINIDVTIKYDQKHELCKAFLSKYYQLWYYFFLLLTKFLKCEKIYLQYKQLTSFSF